MNALPRSGLVLLGLLSVADLSVPFVTDGSVALTVLGIVLALASSPQAVAA